MNPTQAEVKAKLLEQVSQWLDDPGNTTKMSLEFAMARSPTQQPVRVYTLKAEAMVLQAVVPLEEPSIIVPAGPMNGKRF